MRRQSKRALRHKAFILRIFSIVFGFFGTIMFAYIFLQTGANFVDAIRNPKIGLLIALPFIFSFALSLIAWIAEKRIARHSSRSVK